MAKYTEGYHEEIPDPTPVELPIGYSTPESLQQMIARMVRNETLQQEFARQGRETFEEADDFEVEDDTGSERLLSPYELSAMQEEFVDEPRRKPKRSAGVGGERGEPPKASRTPDGDAAAGKTPASVERSSGDEQ